LAYNKDLDYSIIKINAASKDFDSKKIVIATRLLDQVLKECEIGNYVLIKDLKGKDFEGTVCSHPFEKIGYQYDVPMLEANFVTLEQGTGFVHCAPSHGPDDYNLCLNHGIKSLDTIDDDGRYTKHIKKFEGIHIFKADEIVIENLKKCKKLLSNGKLTHSYPHSWRSKAPLVHRATPQWFISMEKTNLRKKHLKPLMIQNFIQQEEKNELGL
jgi:isoleucyl-tRNA synthetase